MNTDGTTLTEATVPLTIIRFPEIKLETRDAHKLRGFDVLINLPKSIRVNQD